MQAPQGVDATHSGELFPVQRQYTGINSGVRRAPLRRSENFVPRASEPRAIFKFGIRNFEFGGGWASSRQLVEQRPPLTLITRLEAFSKPAVDRSEKLASLVHPANAAKVDPDLMGGEVMCEAKASAPAGRSDEQSDWRATPAT
jgi:hypothetical protein